MPGPGPGGSYTVKSKAYGDMVILPVDRQNDRYTENITFPHLCWRTVNINFLGILFYCLDFLY